MWGLADLIKAAAILALLMMASGCAFSFVDKDGYEHSIGFIHQKVKLDGNLLYVEKSTAGLNLNLSKSDAGINLGYKNSHRVFLADNLVLKVDSDAGDAVEVELTPGQ